MCKEFLVGKCNMRAEGYQHRPCVKNITTDCIFAMTNQQKLNCPVMRMFMDKTTEIRPILHHMIALSFYSAAKS